MGLKIIALLLVLTRFCMAQADAIKLSVGQSAELPIQAGQTVRITGKHILSAEDRGTKIVLRAIAPGVSTVKIGDNSYTFEVSGRGRTGLFQTLKAATAEMLGLQVRLENNQVIVFGALHRWADWQALAAVAEPYQDDYQFHARIDDDIKAQVINELKLRLSTRNLPSPNLIFTPFAQAIISEEFKNLSSQWDEILAPFGVTRRYEKAVMAIQPLVRVNIVVAEVNKLATQKFGIEWPDSASAQISPAFNGQNQVLLTLHALERQGLGNVLASPNLLARSGSEAEFLAGGELPVRVGTRYVHDVVWKRHGIYLKIKPTADFSGRVSIELTTEVSMPDKIYDEIPSLKSNRMSTHFDLSEPRTIVLSGLIRNNFDETQEGLPYLSRIPILGRLFSSKDYSAARSELVIFVTPQIVNPHDEPKKMTLPKELKISND